jgi:endo-1,4-beta-xylanase
LNFINRLLYIVGLVTVFVFYSCSEDDNSEEIEKGQSTEEVVDDEETGDEQESVVPKNIDEYNQVEEGLKDYYFDEFVIGAALEPASLEEAMEVELLKRHFGSITAENAMKWSSLQPTEGNFRWGYADQLINFAKENGMKVRGHTLVWHTQVPDWVFQDGGETALKELVLERMKTHITEVMTRYKNDVYVCDVVNEVIDDGNSRYRNSKWYQICGEDYIIEAFKTAREVAPDAKFFYNDYSATQTTKRDKIYNLLKQLKDLELIDGMGLQGHWNIDYPGLEMIGDAIEKYASLGIEIHITEVDISIYRNNDESEMSYYQREAEHIAAYDRAFIKFRSLSDFITNVTFWGIADNHTWLDNFPVKDRKNYPFLFDENYEPKGL